MLLGTPAAEAANAAQIQNYDRWKSLPSQALLDKGNSYWQSGQLDSALVCLSILSNRYNEKMPLAEKELCCKATIDCEDLYHNYFFDYQLAYRYLLKAEEIAAQNQFKQLLAHIYLHEAGLQTNISSLQSNYHTPPDVGLWKKAYRQAVKSGDYNWICSTMTNLITNAMCYGNASEIVAELRSFSPLDIPDSISLKQYTRKMHSGAMAFIHKDYNQAQLEFKELSQTTIPSMEATRIARRRIMALALEAVALDSLHHDKEVVQAYQNIEAIATNYSIYDAETEVLMLLRNYYNKHGNAAMARDYELKYHIKKDQFVNHSKLLSIDQQKFLLDLEKANEEVNELETQKRVRNIILTATLLLVVLLTGMFLYLWRNYKSTKERNVLLFDRVRQLLAQEEQSQLSEKQETSRATAASPGKKYRNNPLDEQAKDELIGRIYAAIEGDQQVYREGFTLDQLARAINANPNYVSQVINERTGKNFNAFINEYRIKEACRRLSDLENYSGYTVEAVGHSVGFKSRANFAATFKKFTGMTPAAYQRMAREGEKPAPLA